jgi:hypothetical protein
MLWQYCFKKFKMSKSDIKLLAASVRLHHQFLPPDSKNTYTGWHQVVIPVSANHERKKKKLIRADLSGNMLKKGGGLKNRFLSQRDNGRSANHA